MSTTPPRSIFWLLFAAVVCALGWTAPALGASGPQFTGIRLGIAGEYKLGCWTRCELTLAGGQAAVRGIVEVTVSDGDGVPARVRGPRPVQVLPGETTPAVVFVRIGREASTIDAVLRALPEEGSRVLAQQRFAPRINSDAMHPALPGGANASLFVEIGPSIGAASAVGTLEAISEDPVLVARVSDAGSLPERWYGYEGVDTVILTTSDPAVTTPLTSTSAQLAALVRWLELGGRLVFCVGAAGPSVLAPDSGLARLAPGRFDRLETLANASALESFVDAAKPLVTGNPVTATLLADVNGRIVASEGAFPLIVRSPFGLGEVVFVAVDLDQPPFRSWGDRRRLVRALLGIAIDENDDLEETDAAPLATTAGFEDLAGQLRGTLDEFPGVRLAPFWLVAVLVLIYIALVGPGDYFFVKRVLKRTGWTWVTFPTIVVATSAGAYFLANWMKGDQLRLNHVEIVDFCLESGTVRGTAWFNVFSPQMETYDVSVTPSVSLTEGRTLVSWWGLAGAGLGGMQSGSTAETFLGRAYDFETDLGAMLDVPIRVWSTKAFTARWEGKLAADAPLETQLVSDVRGTLAGTMTNRLMAPMESCLLAYDRWVYVIDRIEPGETVDLGTLRGQNRDLRNELRGRRADDLAGGQVDVIGWDAFSDDADRIVRQMMFDAASGGREYTGLRGEHQGFVDLSHQLALGRAILVARSSQPASEVHLGEAQLPAEAQTRFSYVRFVIPVTQRPSGGP